MDNRTGIIRFIGSGRVEIDFNHRYAGRTLVYDVKYIKEARQKTICPSP